MFSFKFRLQPNVSSLGIFNECELTLQVFLGTIDGYFERLNIRGVSKTYYCSLFIRWFNSKSKFFSFAALPMKHAQIRPRSFGFGEGVRHTVIGESSIFWRVTRSDILSVAGSYLDFAALSADDRLAR